MSAGVIRAKKAGQSRSRKTSGTPAPKPFFLKVSKFMALSFPVPIKHLRLSSDKPAKKHPGANGLERQGILQSRRRIRINSIDVISNSLIVLEPLYDEIEIKWS
jgi:hypothetical protein